MHSTEKVHDTAVDNENASQHVTCVVVMALCNQSEAFASNLGDDQSRYLFRKVLQYKSAQHFVLTHSIRCS